MDVVDYRYASKNSDEIKLNLPMGDSFILAGKVDEFHYDVSVVLPWLRNDYFSKVDGACIIEDMPAETWKEIFNGPASDLVRLVREALPTIKKIGHDMDLYIEYE